MGVFQLFMFTKRTFAYRLTVVFGLLSVLGFADPHAAQEVGKAFENKSPLSFTMLTGNDVEEFDKKLHAMLSGSADQTWPLIQHFENGASFSCVSVTLRLPGVENEMVSRLVFKNNFLETLRALKKKDATYLKAYFENAQKFSEFLLERGVRNRSIVDLEDVALRYPLTPAAQEALLRAIDYRMGRGEIQGVEVYAKHLVEFYLDSLSPGSLARLEWVFTVLGKPVPLALALEIRKHPFAKRLDSAANGSRIYAAAFTSAMRNRRLHYQPVRSTSYKASNFDLAFSDNPQGYQSYLRLLRFGMEVPSELECSVFNPLAEVVENTNLAASWLGRIQPSDPLEVSEAVDFLLSRAKAEAVRPIIKWAKLKENPEQLLDISIRNMRRNKNLVPPFLEHIARFSPQLLSSNSYSILDASFSEQRQVDDVYAFLDGIRTFSYGLDPWYVEQLSSTNPKRVQAVLEHLITRQFISPVLKKKAEFLLQHGTPDTISRAGVYLASAYGSFDEPVQKGLLLALQDPFLKHEALKGVLSACRKGNSPPADWVFPFTTDPDEGIRKTAGQVLGCLLAQNPISEPKISELARKPQVAKESIYEVFKLVEPTPERILDLKHGSDLSELFIWDIAKRWAKLRPDLDYSPLFPALRVEMREDSPRVDIAKFLHERKGFAPADADTLFDKVREEVKKPELLLGDFVEIMSFLLSAVPQDPRGQEIMMDVIDHHPKIHKWAIQTLDEVKDRALLKPYLKKISTLIGEAGSPNFHGLLPNTLSDVVIASIKKYSHGALHFKRPTGAKPEATTLSFSSKLIAAYFKTSNSEEKRHLAEVIALLPWAAERDFKKLLLIAHDFEGDDSQLSFLRLAAAPVSNAEPLFGGLEKFLPARNPRILFEAVKKALPTTTHVAHAYTDLDVLASAVTAQMVAKEGLEKTEAAFISLPNDKPGERAFRMLVLRKLPTLSPAGEKELAAYSSHGSSVDFKIVDFMQSVSELNERKDEAQVKPMLQGIALLEPELNDDLKIERTRRLTESLKAKPSLALALVEQRPPNSSHVDELILKWLDQTDVVESLQTLPAAQKRKLALELAKMGSAEVDDFFSHKVFTQSKGYLLALQIDSEAVRESPELDPAGFIFRK